jgi:hypothetical protein
MKHFHFSFNNLVIAKLMMNYLLTGITLKQTKLSLCFISRPPRHENVSASGDTTPRILNLGTRGMSVFSFTPRPLYRRERAPGTDWIGGWVGLRAVLDAVKKRKTCCPCQESNLIPWPLSPKPMVLYLVFGLRVRSMARNSGVVVQSV